MVTASQAAPGGLELVCAFVNTADLEEGTDDLAAWLERQGADDDLAGARAVREALRCLLARNNGVDVDCAEAARALDAAAARAGVSLRFGAGGGRLEGSGAVGRVLAAVGTAMADGTWERLKACRSETCRWAFYDHARNRSRTWCSMAVCGNRQKARAYRSRRSP